MRLFHPPKCPKKILVGIFPSWKVRTTTKSPKKRPASLIPFRQTLAVHGAWHALLLLALGPLGAWRGVSWRAWVACFKYPLFPKGNNHNSEGHTTGLRWQWAVKVDKQWGKGGRIWKNKHVPNDIFCMLVTGASVGDIVPGQWAPCTGHVQSHSTPLKP